MTTDPLGRLLDAAVPPIPDELLAPPHERIRRLARRRRLETVTGAFAAVMLLAGSVVLVRAIDRSESIDLPTSTETSAPTARRTAVAGTEWWPLSVRVVLVHRNDTTVTLYVNPDIEACVVSPVSIGVNHEPDRIVVDATGAGIVDCNNIRVAEMVTDVGGVLGAGPFGYRPFYDDDGTQIFSIYEDDLPVMPAPLTLHALESSYLDGTSMTLVYDHRSVERSAIITVTRDWTPADVVAEDIPFGPHTAVMVVAGNNYGVRWRTHGLVYELQYVPDPGEDSTPDGLRDFLASCAWP